MGVSHLLPFLFLISLATAHNITEMLSKFPEYSEYNRYLTETKLSDEINSRDTITILVLNNGAMSALAGKHPLSVVKKALSLLVVLDYYDGPKLHGISKGSVLTTTLYQTTGNAPGNLGFVNITDLKGGKVGFGSAAPGSKLDSSYTKSVKQIPYNISVLEIDAPIISPGLLTAPAPSASDVNITALLEKAGCKTFASLIVSTGVLKIYQNAADKGLTLFAPGDKAFVGPDVPDLTKLSNADVVTLLQYHALPVYSPKGSLKTSKDPLSTLASNGASKYDLTVTTAGDSVTLDTGVDTSRVASTVVDSTPLCIFTVDNLLLPIELFGGAPAPAPGLVPVSAPGPAPVSAPAPESSSAPSPLPDSPPAPPTSSPAGSPADSPDDGSTADDQKAAAVAISSPALFKTLTLTVFAGLLLGWAL
ncbi:Envelope glycoprotein gp160 [Ranunculus cassubicifolius]